MLNRIAFFLQELRKRRRNWRLVYSRKAGVQNAAAKLTDTKNFALLS